MNTKQTLIYLTTVSLCASAFGAARSKAARVTPVRFPVAVEGAAPAARVAGATGDADDSEVVRVKGKGCGATEEAALKDAYRDAVESAVGLYMDAEQMVKNDEVIKDQILTQSNAYIENYDIKEKKVSDGLVTITIWAQVKKRVLTKRIEAMMPAKTFAVGNTLQGVHAQKVTTAKRDDDAAVLLDKALEGFEPNKMILDCSLAMSDPIVADSTRSRGRRSRKGASNSEATTAAIYLFKAEVSSDRYFECIVPRLQATLEQISVVPPKKISISCQRGETPDLEKLKISLKYNGDRAETGLNAGSVTMECSSPLLKDRYGRRGINLPQPYNAMLVTKANSTKTVYEAELYQLAGSAEEMIAKWGQSQRETDEAHEFTISFLSENDETLLQTSWAIRGGSYMERRGASRFFTFAPWLMKNEHALAEEYYWKQVNLPNELLPKIRKIKVEIAE